MFPLWVVGNKFFIELTCVDCGSSTYLLLICALIIYPDYLSLQLGRLYQMVEGLGTKIEKEGLLDKYRKPILNAAYIEEWSSLTKKFLRALPYSLTSSQLSAISEIIWDLKRPVPMNRLLQVCIFHDYCCFFIIK